VVDNTRNIDHAVLLAAGRGTRLRPYTDTTPKPLLPVNGQPALGSVLQQMHLAGIKTVTLVTHYLEEQIEEFINSQPWPLQVATAHQQHPNGTADAALAALKDQPPGPFLMSATDYIVGETFYRDFLDFHKAHSCDVSVSLKDLPPAELGQRSSVDIDPDMNISRIVEKPAPGEAPSTLSANLLFVLPAGFTTYLEAVKPSPRGEYEVQDAINAFLENGGTAKGLVQQEPHEWHAGMLEPV